MVNRGGLLGTWLFGWLALAGATSCAPSTEQPAADSQLATARLLEESATSESYVFGPERELDQRLSGVGRTSSSEPWIAAGLSGVSLVVWAMNGWIVGSRIDADGHQLDANPILISSDGGLSPQVAFDGTYWLVSWGLDGIIVNGSDPRTIRAKRVNPSGTVIDETPIVVATKTVSLRSMSRGLDGWLVAWNTCAGSTCQLYGTRVSQSGGVLDSDGILIATGSSSTMASSLAYNGTHWLAAWSSDTEVRATRIDAGGTLVDAPSIALATGGAPKWNATASSNGSAWLVTWMDGTTTGSSSATDLYGARVGANGLVLDTTAVAFTTDHKAFRTPRSAYDGMNWLVSWGAPTGIRGARMNAAGSVLDPGGFVVDPLSAQPHLDFNGTNWSFAVQRTVASPSSDIFSVRVDSNAQLLDSSPVQVTHHPNEQQNPRAALGNGAWLVVWEDYRTGGNNGRDIYATRVNAQGEALDVPAIAVATGSDEQYSPDVSFDGTNWLVVFSQSVTGGIAIYGKRIDSNGALLDGTPVTIASGSQYNYTPAVSHDGTNWLVVYAVQSGIYDLLGKRVSPSGTVLDTSPIPISTASSLQSNPALSYDGTNWLVVWQDYRLSGGTSAALYGARVSSSGTVLEPAGVQLSSAPVALSYFRSSVTHHGTDWFVSWPDARVGDHYDVYGTRVRPDGTASQSNGTLVAPGITASSPSAASVAPGIFIAWDDEGPIYGTWVDDNAVAASPPLRIANGSQHGHGVAVAAGAQDQLLIVYDSPAPYPRIRSRIFGPAVAVGGAGGTGGGGETSGGATSGTGNGMGVGGETAAGGETGASGETATGGEPGESATGGETAAGGQPSASGAPGNGGTGDIGGAKQGGRDGVGGSGSGGVSDALTGGSGGSTSSTAGAGAGGTDTGGSNAGRPQGGAGGSSRAGGGNAAIAGKPSRLRSEGDAADGCGCRVPGSSPSSHGAMAWLSILLMGGVTRRTRRARQPYQSDQRRA